VQGLCVVEQLLALLLQLDNRPSAHLLGVVVCGGAQDRGLLLGGLDHLVGLADRAAAHVVGLLLGQAEQLGRVVALQERVDALLQLLDRLAQALVLALDRAQRLGQPLELSSLGAHPYVDRVAVVAAASRQRERGVVGARGCVEDGQSGLIGHADPILGGEEAVGSDPPYPHEKGHTHG
jgi:hypothetical protein